MTEQEWLTCTDPTPMLAFLGEEVPGVAEEYNRRPSDLVFDDIRSRKLRLFACACCRRIWHLLDTPGSRRAVEVAERYADRQVGCLSLVLAALATGLTQHTPAHIPGYAASLVGFTRALPEGHAAICARAAAKASGSAEAEAATQAVLLRDIFNNPFRPVRLDRSCRTAKVARIAGATYTERTFDRLAVVADALEEAGCGDAELLEHLRAPGVHVRGCWAVDLLLGKA